MFTFSDACLLDTLDNLTPLGRKHDAPVRFPILDKYKDAGLIFFLFFLSSFFKMMRHIGFPF